MTLNRRFPAPVMSTRRLKLTLPTLRSRTQVEDVLSEIRELTIEKNRRLLDKQEAIQAIEDEHRERLAEIQLELDQKADRIRVWAEANPDEFGNRRSIEMTHGQVGWRTGQPTLKTASGFTWDRVLERLQQFANWNRYIRNKPEVNKAQILADREEYSDADLRQVGLRVVQQESFFVEPQIEEPENRLEA